MFSCNYCGFAWTINNVFFQRVISKLVDYPLETDDGTEDFNATSDHNPYYQPPQEESNVSNLTRCKKRNSAN